MFPTQYISLLFSLTNSDQEHKRNIVIIFELIGHPFNFNDWALNSFYLYQLDFRSLVMPYILQINGASQGRCHKKPLLVSKLYLFSLITLRCRCSILFGTMYVYLISL
jgi:hypothetical protein